MRHFPREGYFFLKSEQSGLYLSINGEDEAGSKIVTGPKTEDESQLWSYENGFLIAKKTSLVIDIDGGDLKSDQKVLQFDRKQTMAHNQRWGIRDGYVYALADPRIVLAAQEEEGTHVKVGLRNPQENNPLHQWSIESYEQPAEEQPQEE